MNIGPILAFHRVATAGSFSEAGRIWGVSQATLSAQVRKLEDDIGRTLFERTGRRIRLTSAGEQLLVATQQLDQALGRVEAVLAPERTGGLRELRISADSAVHVFPVLAVLKGQVDGLKFSLRIDNSAKVIAAVLAGEADIGVMAQAASDPRLHALKIREDRLVALVSAADPLAARKVIRLADLSDQDVVVREPGSITREVAQSRMALAGIKPRQMLDVATREAVAEAVAAGFGIGLVFASEAGNDRRIQAIAISEADVSVAEFVICRVERRRLDLIARYLELSIAIAAERGWITSAPRARATAP
jgi:LysR family transcriptional regulator, low CO2-responsive transcriptional regulator